jgi:hypothetical protein
MKREKAGFVGAGLISGILNGLISTGGPPAILFMSNQGMERDRFRANLITYFLFLNMATVPAHFVGGLLSMGIIRSAALFLPALAGGAYLGTKLVKCVPEDAFRKAVLAVVMATGVMVALSGLGVM